jgi:hypothetical protein
MILTTSMLPPRKFTGSAFAALVRVPKETATIEGTLRTFTSICGSGNPILRHLCSELHDTDIPSPGGSRRPFSGEAEDIAVIFF